MEKATTQSTAVIETGVSHQKEANESFKQRILRKLYPAIRKMGKNGKNGTVLHNNSQATPPVSFYGLKAELNNGTTIDFSAFKGKKVVLVNTASNCGYTGQYAELQLLRLKYQGKLEIIAFPANDFAEQEKGSDQEIAHFCQSNYGVSFPVAKKGVVVKNPAQQPVFQWLTNSEANGWNTHEPDWNFSKYIINEEGNLMHYFGPSVSPVDDEFIQSIEERGSTKKQ